jgi:hypothetical protein
VTHDPEPRAPESPGPEADEADLLEQRAPLEDRPPLDTSKLSDPIVEADEADLFESAQTIPAAVEDEEAH